MNDLILQLGAGGMVAVVILRVVFDFIAKIRPVQQSPEMTKMMSQVAGLYRMHDITDEDGVPVWYVRRSLEAAIEGLVTTIDTMSHDNKAMLETLNKTLESLHTLIEQDRKD